MDAVTDLERMWMALPVGARAAFGEQWAGLAVGGLPCGPAVVDAAGSVVAVGRNHAYDPAGEFETRARYPLQHTRLAHAELNALAHVPTEADHASLTLWTTQHPCSMCAAAMDFIQIGLVRFVADDPSDHAPEERIVASRGAVLYQPLGDPFWWTVSNLLFLTNSAVQEGERARNVKQNRDRYPELVSLALELAQRDVLGTAARSGLPLPVASREHAAAVARVATHAPRALGEPA